METFVVRIWRAAVSETDGSPEPTPTLRGLVQHLGSGRSTPFRSGEELMRSLLSKLAEPPPESGRRQGRHTKDTRGALGFRMDLRPPDGR